MKASDQLASSLRNNKRSKDINRYISFFALALGISEGKVKVLPLEESDKVIQKHRQFFKIDPPCKKQNFSSVEDLKSVLARLVENVENRDVYAFSTPLSEHCGAAKLKFHPAIKNLLNFVKLNKEMISLVDLRCDNSLLLSFDTERSQDSENKHYELELRGKWSEAFK